MIGREKELALLDERYRSGRYEMIPVFGRRRIGKTTLLKEFAKGKRGAYFSAMKGSLSDNERKLAAIVLEADAPVAMEFEDILKEVGRRSAEERYLLIIDEYPNLIWRNPQVGDMMQEFLDSMGGSKLFLILCGSSMSMMKHEVLGASAPIYGRRTGSLELRPFDIWESMRMLSAFPRNDALSIYGMVGGVPMYLAMFDPSLDLKGNVSRLFLEDVSFFRNEHELVLMEEFETPATYYSILGAMAKGYARLSDIAAYCGIDEATAHSHMRALLTTGFAERITPADNPNGRQVRYCIADNFLRFQFGRVLPVVEYQRGGGLATAERILELFARDMGKVFEDICLQHLVRVYRCAPGTWWGTDPETKRQEEIDLVGTVPDGTLRKGWFADCKYRNVPVGRDVLDLLMRRSILVKGYAERRYVIYSRSGFTDGLRETTGVDLYDIDDILGVQS